MTCEECKKSVNRPCDSCNSCGNTPKVIQIDNPSEVVMFHKVIIPASMGDESVTPATNGLYKNALVVYQANGHAFLYSSDGIPSRISFDSGAVLFVDRLPDVEQATAGYLYIDEGGSAAITMDNEHWVRISGGEGGTSDFELLSNRPRYDGRLMDRTTDIPNVNDAVAAEAEERRQADNSLSTDIADEIRNRTDEDRSLQSQIDELDNAINTEENVRFEADSELEEKINTEKTARENEDSVLDGKISNNQTAISGLTDRIGAEETARFEAIADVEEKISDEETARTDADTAIENKLDENVVTDIALDSNTSTTVVKITESKKNLKTGATSPEEIVLPVASKTQAGVMNSSIFESIENNSNNIANLMNGAVMTNILTAQPNQQQILTAWQMASGETTPLNSASVWDNVNHKKYTYFSAQSQWVLTQDGLGGEGVTVNQWTNDSAGIVKGSTNDGQIFAESDGTGSVNGWDEVKSNAELALTKSTNNETLIAGKENTVTAGTTSQYYRGDKTWQTLNKAAVGLGNVDNTSDANKPISTATQNALNAKQNTLTPGSNIQINGNTISATDTTYTAGEGIRIDGTTITNTRTSAEWGNITGTLSSQTDLKAELDKKIEAENPIDAEEVESVVSTSMIQNWAVTNSKIANGAITKDKLAFTIDATRTFVVDVEPGVDEYELAVPMFNVTVPQERDRLIGDKVLLIASPGVWDNNSAPRDKVFESMSTENQEDILITTISTGGKSVKGNGWISQKVWDYNTRSGIIIDSFRGTVPFVMELTWTGSFWVMSY